MKVNVCIRNLKINNECSVKNERCIFMCGSQETVTLMSMTRSGVQCICTLPPSPALNVSASWDKNVFIPYYHVASLALFKFHHTKQPVRL